MEAPRLSVVILTRNEAEHVGSCLASLAAQTTQRFEVVVVDAASTDGTVERVRATAANLPVPLNLEASDEILPIGEARNRGVSLSRAPNVAFLSADAELDENWIERALETLATADVVYGRQVHAPDRATTPAAVRTLRYQFPRTRGDDPERYASNVAAAYRRGVLERFPLRVGEDVVDDLLLARRAARDGAAIAYNPSMVVYHHDVHTLRGELSKNRREGEAWGRHVDELGPNLPVLAWGAALAAATALLVLNPVLAGGLLTAGLWTPALRRALRRRGEVPPRALVRGLAASPPFDLAFLVHYVKGLTAWALDRSRSTDTKELRT